MTDDGLRDAVAECFMGIMIGVIDEKHSFSWFGFDSLGPLALFRLRRRRIEHVFGYQCQLSFAVI